MTSDCSSAGSSSSEELKRKRKHKKQTKESDKKHKKSKKHKKEKKHKLKKRSRKEAEEPINVEKPKLVKNEQVLPNCGLSTQDEDAFGPALPPHLMVNETKIEPQTSTAATIIGPVIPSELLNPCAESTADKSPTKDDDDEDMTGAFGPLPHTTQVELEERALTLKLAALDGAGLGSGTVDQEVREEWMLELPEVGLKGGLAALNNLKRTFHQGKERPDFSDRSSWTKTPQSVAAAAASGPKPSTSKEMEKTAQARYEQQRDAEQESIAKKHKKKHKRDESLVEMHQKKLRKEQKQKEKELAALGEKPDRRPFSRDVDLKMNKIDKNQTKQIVDKAKILNTKFSTGQAKYL